MAEQTHETIHDDVHPHERPVGALTLDICDEYSDGRPVYGWTVKGHHADSLRDDVQTRPEAPDVAAGQAWAAAKLGDTWDVTVTGWVEHVGTRYGRWWEALTVPGRQD